jgi:acetyl-CoA carboxylase biotin carboxyl carrier protein
MSELTHTDVDTILRILDQMEGREIHLEIGDLKLHVTPGGGAADSSPTDAVSTNRPTANTVPEPRPVVDIPPGCVAVRAPTIGTFYRAASPGAKPYAEVGDHVTAVDTVGMFEVMKLFTSLSAGVDGSVKAFLVANDTLVERDQPLVLIEPDRA